MPKIIFDKYHGNGNDFIIIDSRNSNIYNSFLKKEIFSVKDLCDRNFGVGADGVIFISEPSNNNNDAKMIIYNSDNSEAEMCGNGIRCMIEYLHNNKKNQLEECIYKIETKAGLKVGKYKSGIISVQMGKPIFESNKIPTTIFQKENSIPFETFTHKEFSNKGYAVGMGNPHLIIFTDNLESISYKLLGPIFEKSKYFPEKTNVHFAQVINSQKINVKVWERGAGPTLACGTGACAVHAAAFKLGMCSSKTDVHLPGGNLNIEWSDNNDDVIMSGNAKKIFNGFIN